MSLEMMRLLEGLRAWPEVDLEQLRQRPEWVQAIAWGWVMPSGELTGTGLRHAGGLSGGIVTG